MFSRIFSDTPSLMSALFRANASAFFLETMTPTPTLKIADILYGQSLDRKSHCLQTFILSERRVVYDYLQTIVMSVLLLFAVSLQDLKPNYFKLQHFKLFVIIFFYWQQIGGVLAVEYSAGQSHVFNFFYMNNMALPTFVLKPIIETFDCRSFKSTNLVSPFVIQNSIS